MINRIYNLKLKQGGAIEGSTFLGSLKQGDNFVNTLKVNVLDNEQNNILLSAEYVLYLHIKRADLKKAYLPLKRNTEDNCYQAELPNYLTSIPGKLECNVEVRAIKTVNNDEENITIIDGDASESVLSDVYYIGFSDMFSFNVERSSNAKTEVDYYEPDALTEIETRLDENIQELKEVSNSVNEHTADINNPHFVTKKQIGLSNVDNTSDINKPISMATQDVLDKKLDKSTEQSMFPKAYVKDENGNQIMKSIAPAAYPNAIWQFDSSGYACYQMAPKTQYDVSNKKYVDECDNKLLSVINSQIYELNELKESLYGYIFGLEEYTFENLDSSTVPNVINGKNIVPNTRGLVNKIKGISVVDNGDIKSITIKDIKVGNTILSFPQTTLLGINQYGDELLVDKNENDDFYTISKLTRIKAIDLSNAIFSKISGEEHSFITNLSPYPFATNYGEKSLIICSSTQYTVVSPMSNETIKTDKSIAVGGNGFSLRIVNNDCSTVAELKQTLMGVNLAYIIRSKDLPNLSAYPSTRDPEIEIIASNLTKNQVTALINENSTIEILENENSELIKPNLTMTFVVKNVEDLTNE